MENNVLAPTKAARMPRTKKSLAGVASTPTPLIVTFARGLVGCPEWQRFHLEPMSIGTCGEMVCLDQPGMSLLVANPSWLHVNYSFELDEDDVDDLHLNAAEDAHVMCILTMHRDADIIAANLAGPLVINIREGLGRQVILDHYAYPLRAPVITGLAARALIVALDSFAAPGNAPSHTPAAEPEKGAKHARSA